MGANGGAYDVIVIGAGHNGLTAACMVAKGGRRVVVLERREVTGGLCAGEEFHPGYHTAGLPHDTTGMRKWVADKLALHEHGLVFAPDPLEVYSPQRGGRGLILSRDPERAAGEIGALSANDTGRYREYQSFLGRVRGVVSDVMNEVPADWIDIGGGGVSTLFRRAMAIRRLGKRDMIELVRVAPMCVADWVNYWFENELLKCSLASPAVMGGWCGPWSPGTSTNLLLWECLAGRPVEGGPAAVISALGRAAGHLGVEIRTGTEVGRIRVGKNRVEGVRLAGGEEIDAPVVLSSCDPKTTFLGMLQPNEITPKFEGRVRSYRMRGTTAKVHLALDRPLEFEGRPGQAIEYARTGEELDAMERAFDPVKYRQMPERPLLDIFVPSVARPELAPDGHAVVSILVHFVPYDYEVGWTDGERERLGDHVLAELESYAPGVSRSIVAREVLTPLDIETRYGVTGGHIYHGEHGLDQIAVRPTPETSCYATPIGGLFICGGGSHPGGGVSCAPGALAASVAAKHA
jgi:phytoene dehydrogenase-like protein